MDAEGYKLIIEALIEQIDDGVYIIDGDGKGIFYNKAMEQLEHLASNDVIGKEFQKAFPGIRLNESSMFKAVKLGKATKNIRQEYTSLYGREIATENTTVPVIQGEDIIAGVEIARKVSTIGKISDTFLGVSSDEGNKNTKKNKIKRYTFDDIIGENKKFRESIARAKKASEIDASVFIYGETGTGKELFSQSIHYDSKRKNKPFLAQNCAALPESLLEGILFGTSKGGFTGAVDRAGLFEQASGGTLLLDEISAMPYELQSKLLRVLQEDYIRRVGGEKDIPINTRIIATVNEDPIKLMESGKLRKDLFYRLSVVNVNIPPLRERKDDIPILAKTFLKKYSEKYEKPLAVISDSAIKRLVAYTYPGNARELENIIAQAVSMADDEDVLTGKMIQMPVYSVEIMEKVAERKENESLSDYLADVEKELIRDAMVSEKGNISKAAESLKIKRQTLQHKIKKYNIR